MSIVLSLDIYDNSYRLLLQRDDKLLDFCTNERQTDVLLLKIEDILKKNFISYEDVDFLSVNCGPTSFTLSKAVMTFAKGFHCCYPKKKIIINNGFEILAFREENFNIILMKMSEDSCYVYDKSKYFYSNNLNNLQNMYSNNCKILINNDLIATKIKDIGFKNVCLIENTFDKVIGLNYSKMLINDFTNVLEPLYIREPDINLRKK